MMIAYMCAVEVRPMQQVAAPDLRDQGHIRRSLLAPVREWMTGEMRERSPA